MSAFSNRLSRLEARLNALPQAPDSYDLGPCEYSPALLAEMEALWQRYGKDAPADLLDAFMVKLESEVSEQVRRKLDARLTVGQRRANPQVYTVGFYYPDGDGGRFVLVNHERMTPAEFEARYPGATRINITTEAA